MSLNKKSKEVFKEQHATFQYNRLHELPQALASTNKDQDGLDAVQSFNLSSVLGPLYLTKFFRSCKKNKIILPGETRGAILKTKKLKKWDKYEQDIKGKSKDNSAKSPRSNDGTTKFCEKCGNLRVYGSTTKVRTLKKNEDFFVELHCLLCDSKALFNASDPPTVWPTTTTNDPSVKETTPVVQGSNTPKNVLNKLYIGTPSPPPQGSSLTSNKVSKPVNKNISAKQRSKKRKTNTLADVLKQKKLKEENKSKSSLSLADFLKK